ncbi:hypothetical protein MMC17_008276 [Xylographa soralifera]|nr:hypothetical protein [Xylographa soralifera]
MSQTKAQAIASKLAHANLFLVTNNRDPISRRATMDDIYHEDVVVYESDDKILHGRDEVDKHIQKLLGDREGWEFQTKGKTKLCHDLVYVAWGFGPEGALPVLTGADHFFVSEGKIKKLYVVVDGIADLKES